MPEKPENTASHIISVLKDSYPKDANRSAQEKLAPTGVIKCPRGAFMERLGYREPVSFASEINFGYGNMRHDRIQDCLLGKGILHRNPEPHEGKHPAEFYFETEDPPMHGYADGLLIGGGVLEIKTTGKPLSKIKAPFESHLDQMHLYLWAFEESTGLLLYEGKDAEDRVDPWKEFQVELEEDRLERVLKRARSLKTHLDIRRLPWPDNFCFCDNPACWDEDVHKKEGLR